MQCRQRQVKIKNLYQNNNLDAENEPRVPNECIHLIFWWPIKCFNESDKDVLVAVDRFSRWPSAMICKNNKLDKVLRFISKYLNTHFVHRKIYLDQGSIFTSKVVEELCSNEGIEIVYSPVKDQRIAG